MFQQYLNKPFPCLWLLCVLAGFSSEIVAQNEASQKLAAQNSVSQNHQAPGPDVAGRINLPMIQTSEVVLSSVTNQVTGVFVSQGGERPHIEWEQKPGASEIRIFLGRHRLAGTNLVVETADKSQQFAEGRIAFVATGATLENGVGLSKSANESRLVGWSSSATASWQYKPTRWGMYQAEVAYSAENAGPNDELEIQIAGKTFSLPVKATGSQDRFRTTTLGQFYLAKADPFQVKAAGKTLQPNSSFSLKSITLIPAPEGPTPIQKKDETIILGSHQATTHSVTMRYEPQDNKKCLGYWVNQQDWADWHFKVAKPGTYQVELFQGCGKGHGGSEVEVIIGSPAFNLIPDKSFQFVVEETGHFQTFIPRMLGTIHFLEAGPYTLEVRPKRKQGGAVMDIQQIKLLPMGDKPGEKPEALKDIEGKRLVILGDSITYGGEYVEMVEAYLRMVYPASPLDIINIGLPSETVSGLSEPGHAGGSFPRPGVHERLDRVLAKVKPDFIVACYGMNDGIYYPLSEDRFKAFHDGIMKLRQKAEAAGARVVHLTPPVFDAMPLKGNTLPHGLNEYKKPYEGYDEVLEGYSEWLISQRVNDWEVIDIHGPMKLFLQEQRKTNPTFLLAGDGVHANTQGHWIMAREILRGFGASEKITASPTSEILQTLHPRAAEIIKLIQQRHRTRRDAWLNEVGHKRPGMGKGKPVAEAEAEAKQIEIKLQEILPAGLPGKRSVWNGFDRFDFQVDGKDVLVVAPKKAAEGKPWVWHGEFFGHKPNPDIAVLGRGFHVVYLSVPDMLGSPKAVEHWNKLHTELTTKYGFSKKPALVGLSRGGLYCYNWAAANADKVSCIYADAPVCDFKSWPGAFGKGKRSDRDWNLVLQQWGFKNDEEAKAYAKNPVDNLKPLADAKVPLLHVFGDADEVVPWDENTGLIAERYKAMGGYIELIRKAGVKHHPHGLDDSTPIVEFIAKHAGLQGKN